LYQAATDRQ